MFKYMSSIMKKMQHYETPKTGFSLEMVFNKKKIYNNGVKHVFINKICIAIEKLSL